MVAADNRFNRKLIVLVLASLAFLVVTVVLRLGLDRTSYDAVDSAGRTMGFNDRFGAEHYAIILRGFVPSDFLSSVHAYEWLLLAMHLIGATLLWRGSTDTVRLTRRFFALQPLVFPFAVPGLLIAPMMIVSIITGQADRESFVDLPFFICTAQPVWLLTSIAMVLAMRGPGLGLSKAWSTIKSLVRGASGIVANAAR